MCFKCQEKKKTPTYVRTYVRPYLRPPIDNFKKYGIFKIITLIFETAIRPSFILEEIMDSVTETAVKNIVNGMSYVEITQFIHDSPWGIQIGFDELATRNTPEATNVLISLITDRKANELIRGTAAFTLALKPDNHITKILQDMTADGDECTSDLAKNALLIRKESNIK